jgi:hypothetical protein
MPTTSISSCRSTPAHDHRRFRLLTADGTLLLPDDIWLGNPLFKSLIETKNYYNQQRPAPLLEELVVGEKATCTFQCGALSGTYTVLRTK